MTWLQRRKPSASMIVALVALFVALGGSSYAAVALSKNSVGSKQLKKNAVTTSKIRNQAVTAGKINPAGLTVPNANALGGQSASAYQSASKLMFATVGTSSTGATVLRGRGAVGAGRFTTGIYYVSFDQPIANCTWIATYGATDDGAAGPYFVTVEGRAFTSHPNDLEIRERDLSGTYVDGSGFHIEVLCP